MQNTPHHAAASFREFVGGEGAAQLSLTGTDFTPLGSAPFRARVHSIPLDRTRVVSIRITPHRGELRADIGSMRPELVFFTFHLTGRSVGSHDGRRQIDTPGSIHFIRVGAPYHYVAAQAAHNVSWWVTLPELQPEVAQALRRVTAMEFRDDATARGATAIIRSIVTAPPAPGSPAAASLERILIAHVEAVVMAAEAHRLDPKGANRRLFHELRELLGADLSRSQLSITGVADELDTTPALLSHCLVAQGTSLRRLMAEERLDRLTGLLRDPAFAGSLADAVHAAGYGGMTQASRAFKAKFGMTMGRYRMALVTE